jgi:hypothetical protein
MKLWTTGAMAAAAKTGAWLTGLDSGANELGRRRITRVEARADFPRARKTRAALTLVFTHALGDSIAQRWRAWT